MIGTEVAEHMVGESKQVALESRVIVITRKCVSQGGGRQGYPG